MNEIEYLNIDVNYELLREFPELSMKLKGLVLEAQLLSHKTESLIIESKHCRDKKGKRIIGPINIKRST